MSEEIKVVNCPNCGASATNLQNCEYCGSLFVRCVEKEIVVTDYFSNKNEFNGFVFKGLNEEILKNIELQKNKQYSFVNTDIIINNEIYAQVAPSNLSKVMITLTFEIDSSLEKKFLLLPESKLFEISHAEERNRYDLEFGEDTLGASSILSMIIIKVYGFNKETIVTYNTWFDKKGKCFIATATMGSYEHPQVMELRDFRDNWILTKTWGESFVEWYYHYGAKVAKVIDKSYILKKLSYLLIVKPLVYLSRIVKINK